MGGRVKWNLGKHTARTRADAPVVYACMSEHDRHVPQVLLYHGKLGDGKISIQSCRRSMGTTTRGQKDLVKIGSPTPRKRKKKTPFSQRRPPNTRAGHRDAARLCFLPAWVDGNKKKIKKKKKNIPHQTVPTWSPTVVLGRPNVA